MTATSEGIDASVRSAVRATYAVFIASGVAFASWASRIPQVRDRFHLDPSELGLVLLAMAAGSVIALPLSGVIIGHFGSRWTVRTTALLVAVAMAVSAIAAVAVCACVIAAINRSEQPDVEEESAPRLHDNPLLTEAE